MIKKILTALTVFAMLGTMPCGAYAEETTETKTTETTEPTEDTGDTVEPLIGDANNDGAINVRDCAVIAKAFAYKNTDSLPATADYNGDGVINIRDAAALAANYVKALPHLDNTQTCLSELKISGGQATCSSVIRGYSGKTTRIIINQTLQKKSGSRWVTVKAWSSTVRGYFGSVKKKKSGLSRNTYRLKTTGIIYSGKKSESVTKFSDEKRYI